MKLHAIGILKEVGLHNLFELHFFDSENKNLWTYLYVTYWVVYTFCERSRSEKWAREACWVESLILKNCCVICHISSLISHSDSSSVVNIFPTPDNFRKWIINIYLILDTLRNSIRFYYFETLKCIELLSKYLVKNEGLTIWML